MNISAEFVRSAARLEDFPRDRLSEVALVGRSNVGKSSLINFALRQRIARTSAAPGKTRLANIYRVRRGRTAPFYLVDLPGYGYARGGHDAAAGFAGLTRAYFGRDRLEDTRPVHVAALLLVDARHPGLDSDLEAWRWMQTAVADCGVVATKVDKLARGERIRALRALDSVLGVTVLPVSAVTGEGLDQLWKLIDRLANSPNPNRHRSSPPGAPQRHQRNP